MSPMRCYAIKGSKNRLKNPVEAPKRTSRSSALLVDTSEFKTMIFSRLKVLEPGPRYSHFPKSYDDEFFAQLTAEKVVSRWVKGVHYLSWENVRPNKRNEALDIRVYNHAALHILNVNWDRLKSNLNEKRTLKEYVLKSDKPEAEGGVKISSAAMPPPKPVIGKKRFSMRMNSF